MIQKYFFYLVRWQLSTPILAGVLVILGNFGVEAWVSTVVANLLGGLLFFWVDKFIFKAKFEYPFWTVKEGECNWCRSRGRTYRKLVDKDYDARSREPLWLCERCSKIKDINK